MANCKNNKSKQPTSKRSLSPVPPSRADASAAPLSLDDQTPAHPEVEEKPKKRILTQPHATLCGAIITGVAVLLAALITVGVAARQLGPDSASDVAAQEKQKKQTATDGVNADAEARRLSDEAESERKLAINATDPEKNAEHYLKAETKLRQAGRLWEMCDTPDSKERVVRTKSALNDVLKRQGKLKEAIEVSAPSYSFRG